MTYKGVLKQIKPSKRERDQMNKFTNKLVKKIKKISKNATPLVCGSVAKDTWLSNKKEIDLFLLFPTKLSKKDLEKQGLSLAKEIVKEFNGKYEIAFSEHPYLKAYIKGFEIDIVPCYFVKHAENLKSSVDRTPFHVKFVQKSLKASDDVRLLKQFCISNECYGADAKRQGFSGYLCELLIIKNKSFMKCVKNASKWKAGKVITFTKIDSEKLKKYKTPLIVIDPVDKNRNAGAAVSVESFYRFVKACKDFIKKPSSKFFLPKKVKPYSFRKLASIIKKRETNFYLIKFKRPKILDDILYSQMRRCLKSVDRLFSENGFKILRSGFYCNKDCFLIYEMEVWKVSKIMKHEGPNVYSKHAENFLKHYKDDRTFIENNNWIIELQRSFIDGLEFLKHLIKKREKGLLKIGIPSKIAPAFKKASVYGDKNFLRGMNKSEKEFKEFFRKWFEEDLY